MKNSLILSHRERLIKGELTNEKFVREQIDKIEQHRHLNIFPEVFKESAIRRAKELDNKLKEGKEKPGKLFGAIIAIKDNICFEGHTVTASSRILEGFKSLYSATCVERLLKEDAIIIGRTGCDEFAMGSSNETSVYGPVKNPWDENRVPGGSSGGSAAAVAAGLCHAALGSDTGGSIRQPASFTGVLGIKPTYGRVSRWGLISYASSFDQIGPLAHTAQDLALILEVISGADEFDTTASQRPVVNYSAFLDSEKKYSFSYIKECLEHKGLDETIRKKFFEQCDLLKSKGYEVREISFPFLDYLVPAYYVLTTAEASSNLARYDGVRFGYRSPRATNMEEVYTFSRSEGFGTEVKRRIMLGTFVLSAGYYEAYYAHAQKVRRLIRNETLQILKNSDFIITPTTPGVAFPFGKNSSDPIQMYLEDIFTVQAPLAGIPAVSVPLGFKTENGKKLPFGLQLMAGLFEENKIFQFLYTMGY